MLMGVAILFILAYFQSFSKSIGEVALSHSFFFNIPVTLLGYKMLDLDVNQIHNILTALDFY